MWKGGSLVWVPEDLSWKWGRAGSKELQAAACLWTCVLSLTNLWTSLCVRETQDMPGLQRRFLFKRMKDVFSWRIIS